MAFGWTPPTISTAVAPCLRFRPEGASTHRGHRAGFLTLPRMLKGQYADWILGSDGGEIVYCDISPPLRTWFEADLTSSLDGGIMTQPPAVEAGVVRQCITCVHGEGSRSKLPNSFHLHRGEVCWEGKGRRCASSFMPQVKPRAWVGWAT